MPRRRAPKSADLDAALAALGALGEHDLDPATIRRAGRARAALDAVRRATFDVALHLSRADREALGAVAARAAARLARDPRRTSP